MYGYANRGFEKDLNFEVGNLNISDMSLADDMVIFWEATLQNVQNMLHVIDQFCVASGQRINFAKSQVIVSDKLPKNL